MEDNLISEYKKIIGRYELLIAKNDEQIKIINEMRSAISAWDATVKECEKWMR